MRKVVQTLVLGIVAIFALQALIASLLPVLPYLIGGLVLVLVVGTLYHRATKW